MENISVPKPESDLSDGGLLRSLRLATNALTLTASAIALSSQVIEHFQKPKAARHERTKAGTALLGLAVLRTLPGLISSARTLAADLKRSKQ